MKRKLISYPLLFLGLCLVASAVSSEIVDSERYELGDGIAHYTFDLDLGPDEFDMVRLHRIVKERRPFQPVATTTGLFMLPGAPNSFEMIFAAPLISPDTDWDHSVAVFLAKNGIDVWGMDYGWAQIPLQQDSDPQSPFFGFMEGWGLAREIQDTREALATVRSIRVATGQGNRRLHLLGFSYGVAIAYGLAGDETQLPPGQRHVKGLIQVDSDLKVDNPTEREDACDSALIGQNNINNGIFRNANGVFLAQVGELAETDANGLSPFPPFTNLQFALFLGAFHDPWHFVGGAFPFITLLYTNPVLWVDALQAVPFYVPVQAFLDINLTLACDSGEDCDACDGVDLPFDDHLGEITLPILAVGAAGGAAPDPFTPSLTASGDVEQFTVQLLDSDQVMFDFGHADLFFATDAEALVWQPLLDWLLAHREDRTYPSR